MAVIRDVMPAFQLFQPGSLADARSFSNSTDRTPGSWPAASTASTG